MRPLLALRLTLGLASGPTLAGAAPATAEAQAGYEWTCGRTPSSSAPRSARW